MYVDDMLVKSLDEERHLDDLQETFNTFRRHQMKLNPKKCAFGVSSGKFLGFMVSQRGIKANPDKIQAILDMEPPKNIKEVQSLTRRIAALNKFVSKATDKCLPFFRILRKAFEWTNQCQKAFQALKVYLTTTPLLSPSILGEELYLYLAVSPYAVSSALIRESAEACILYKPSIERSRRMISADGEIVFCINNGFQEVKALLPSTCNCCNDGSSTQEVDEQVGSHRMFDPIGYRA